MSVCVDATCCTCVCLHCAFLIYSPVAIVYMYKVLVMILVVVHVLLVRTRTAGEREKRQIVKMGERLTAHGEQEINALTIF